MWPNSHFPADVITFTEEILNGKLHFLCNIHLDHLCDVSAHWNKDFYIESNVQSTLKQSKLNNLLRDFIFSTWSS